MKEASTKRTRPATTKKRMNRKTGPSTAKRKPAKKKTISPPSPTYKALKEMDKDFEKLAAYILQGGQLGRERTDAFKSNFGVTIPTFKAILHQIKFPHQLKPKNVLMGLCWLKIYPTEHVLCRLSGYSCRKTVRHYVGAVVKAICSHMPKVFVHFCFVCPILFPSFLLCLSRSNGRIVFARRRPLANMAGSLLKRHAR